MSKCAAKGYDEAVAREMHARNVVYLGQPEIVCGEPLNNITPYLLGVLTVAESPFIVGGNITAANVAQFLWALHRDYSAPSFWNRQQRLIRKRLRIISYARPMYESVEQINAFLDVTFMDRPNDGKPERPTVSNTAALIYRFRNKPWCFDDQKTLNMPLRILYQELRCWERENTEQPIINPSDAHIAVWQAEINRLRKLWDEGDKENGISSQALDEYNRRWYPNRYGGKN